MKVDFKECAIFCFSIYDECMCVCVWGDVYVFFIIVFVIIISSSLHFNLGIFHLFIAFIFYPNRT